MTQLSELHKIKFSVPNLNLVVATAHLPIISCDCVIGGFYGEENHVGPRFRQRPSSCGHPRGGSRLRQSSGFRQSRSTLETVKAFGDDFRLVGIGVSAKGRVFATAPSSNLRSRFSMVQG